VKFTLLSFFGGRFLSKTSAWFCHTAFFKGRWSRMHVLASKASNIYKGISLFNF
jgi:hypothetical protein